MLAIPATAASAGSKHPKGGSTTTTITSPSPAPTSTTTTTKAPARASTSTAAAPAHPAARAPPDAAGCRASDDRANHDGPRLRQRRVGLRAPAADDHHDLGLDS